jgi:aspartate aminotransferase-like enzyme
LAFAAVSDRALERAARVPQRGWYFDFLLLEKYLQQNNTPATPAISLLYALDAQLERILAEGLQPRFARHARMADLAQTWADSRFALFARAGFRSKTVTTITNTRGINVVDLSAHLARAGMAIANGYGRLKGKTFRIGHMGEITPDDVAVLLAEIDRFLSAG